jgi:hypothetical protein
MKGGGGVDLMHFAYDGELDGALGLYMSGGDGDDWVGASVLLRASSTGQIGGEFQNALLGAASVEGDGGSDHLAFHIDDRSDHHVNIDALIDGDNDFTRFVNKSPFDWDTASHTSNVRVQNCDTINLRTT